MTGQTLQTLQNYPQEREVLFSADTKNDTTRIQADLTLLNTKKSDIDKTNEFTDVQTFSGGIAYTGTDVTASTYSISENDTSVYFDNTAASIAATLPLAADVIGQEFDFLLKTNVDRYGENSVEISVSESDTLNSTGNNKIAMNTVDDYIKLKAIASGRWLVIINNNCTLSTV